ncbi:MAG: heparinase II/III family protein [Bacteroidia bacterium]
MKLNYLFILFLSYASSVLMAKEIPANRVLKTEELPAVLNAEIYDYLQLDGKVSEAKLAEYFRHAFSERFFYDYQTFYDRLTHYNGRYNNQDEHKARALDHMGKYADSTQWILPFNYLNGQEVNAYALRHLARQHKMVDIALLYFHDGKDPKYIRYFENQMQSLNAALESGQFEKIEDGNGVYEVYRSGYRILNWIWIHNMFLNEPEYSDADQLRTIATLLQHAQHLYERNAYFRSGNHQTRGMSAMAILSILLRDFEGTEKWYERSMSRLGEHLNKEINPDGFQFERSVHYHMSDINTFFYVYQLAKISKIEVDKAWEEKLRSLFTTLTKIAYPDKSAPVLQDDTEIPWAEKNDISGAMTLGYLLFEDPNLGYFASDKVDDRMYWYLSKSQVEMLENIQQEKPTYGSLAFEDTHYYIMREGWNPNDKMMIISAGLDAEKPDHQHGDMLGIQAIANGQPVLPNYQVRYSLKDFELFKNSMVKNVALVDNELQGREWTSNKGGSGFGKFKSLPHPEVIVWESNEDFDLFVGSHDGFEHKGVAYTRQVIYIKDDFWIVKDNFKSESQHEYKQVWQGHYTQESGPRLIRASFADASGLDILQLNQVDKAYRSGSRGKTQTVIAGPEQNDFHFLTVIFPYRGYLNRIDESEELIKLLDWQLNQSSWALGGNDPSILSKNEENYCFGVDELHREKLRIQISQETDLYIRSTADKLIIQLLGDTKVSVTVINNNKTVVKELLPGEKWLVE